MTDNNNPTPTPDSSKSAIKHNLSLVASNAQKSIAILIVIVAILGYVLYITIFSLTDSPEKDVVKKPQIKPPANVIAPESSVIPTVSQVPELPSIPQIVQPSSVNLPVKQPVKEEKVLPKTAPVPLPVAPVQPTPPVPVPTPPPTKPKGSQPGEKDPDARRKTGIMLINNPQKTANSDQQAKLAQQDNYFKSRSNMRYLLAKGKIIEIILETAINTDRPGEIRGMIARDVYAEDRKTKLIPKGSKVFGSFQTTINDVYGIITVNWNRIDLATGYSLELSSGISVDNLGRTGITGRLDNKYKEQVTSKVISSAISIGLANVLDKVIVPGSNTLNAQKYSALSKSLSSLNTSFVAQMATLVATATTASDTTSATTITNTCASALGYFWDTSISGYSDLSTACDTAKSSGAGSDHYATTYQNLSTAIQTAASTVATLASSNDTSSLTSTQNAFKTAVSDATDMISGFVTSKQYTPNVTLQQGELIRVYIDRDYIFPAKAVGSATRLMP